MREISESFIEDLKTGFLSPLVTEVKKNEHLCLEIRNNNKIRIYCLGYKMLELTQQKSGSYKVAYCEECIHVDPFENIETHLNPKIVRTKEEIEQWIQVFQQLLKAIETYTFLAGKKTIYHSQNMIENYNSLETTGFKNFVFCDQVYENRKIRSPVFDIMALEFTLAKTKNLASSDWRLAIIELIPDYTYINGIPRIVNRLENTCRLLDHTEKLEVIRSEIVNIFRQKQKIGLIDTQYEVSKSSTQKPMLIYLPSNGALYPDSLYETLNNLNRVGFSYNSAVEIFTSDFKKTLPETSTKKLFKNKDLLKLLKN